MLEFSSKKTHPIFRASSALERGELRSKGGSKKSIHFNGSAQNVDLILRTIISAKSAQYLGGIQRCHGFGEAHDPLKSMDILTEPPTADPRTDEQRRGNLLQDYDHKFEQLSDAQKLSKLCSNAGLKTVARGQYFITLDAEGPSGRVHSCREFSLLRNDPRTQARGWIRRNTKIGPVIIMSMYNDIVWRERRKHRKVCYEFYYSCELCSQILARTLVILGTWIREEMVRNLV